MANELIGVEEVAKRLGLSVQTVRAYTGKGIISLSQIGAKHNFLYDSNYIDIYKERNLQYNKDELLNTTQVANILRVNYSTVVNYTRKGLIKPICTNLLGKTQYLKKDIDAFNESLGDTDIDSLFTTSDLATIFACQYATIYAWKKGGIIKVVRTMPNGDVYYAADSVDRIQAFKTGKHTAD